MKCYNCGRPYHTDNPPHGAHANLVLCERCATRWKFVDGKMVWRIGLPTSMEELGATVQHVAEELRSQIDAAKERIVTVPVPKPPDAGLRHRPGDQPLPTHNHHPSMHDLVAKDMMDRKTLGLKRYGTVLQPFNGRSFTRDAYEEVLDTAVYLRGKMEEEALAPYSELVEVLRAILNASDRCHGHSLCDHSMEPWQRGHKLLNRIDGGPTGD